MRSPHGVSCLSDRIRSSLSASAPSILAAGPFGSEEDDLDILVVFRSAGQEKFVSLCESLRVACPNALFYPTFRLQALLEATGDKKARSIHLLMYPSRKTMYSVERSFVRYCILRSFVPWVGDRGALVQEGEQRPAPDIAYYVNLLFETLQIYLMDSFPADAAVLEAQKKLQYIIKFATLEVFYADDGGIDLRRVAATVFAHVPPALGVRAGDLFARIKNWDCPSRAEVLDGFEKTGVLLEDLSSFLSH